jgi:regulator of replication initiation timing
MVQRQQEPQVVVLPNGADVNGENAVDLNQLANRISELEGQLVAVQAERDQLISERDALQQERDDLAAELAECEELVTLWEQHHAVGLDNLVSSSLTLLAPMLVALLALADDKLLPAVLRLRGAFARVLAALPTPIEGIQWLAQKVVTLNQRLDALRERVTEAVEPVSQFTDLITDFILWVLDRLPFGAGDQAQAGLEAMRNTINILPEFVEGVENDVLDPLADWFSEDDDQNLRGTLLTPTVENIFDPLEDLLADLGDFRETFVNTLREPAENALAERQDLRAEIEERTEALRRRKASA